MQLLGCTKPSENQAADEQMPAPKVKIAQPLQKEVLEWDEYTGRGVSKRSRPWRSEQE
ncbi:efflux transporter, RND family, MFP subunit [Methylocaldum marinum]|uniref:Efflux transporter, RND family, MFP subunit n=1 Tax=Methylocaldum marinum TaxID=1432792 RepID=A0A250KR05_9GAMM|nr:efflux transporter, RND family, MFP subunit [Methylocaldum marinum]